MNKRNGARQLIREGTRALGSSPSSQRTCEAILSELLNLGRTALYLDEKEIPEEISNRFLGVIRGLQEGEPLQYLLGEAPFMGDLFQVSPSCFIPRPETEGVVEACLDYFKERQATSDPSASLGMVRGMVSSSNHKRQPLLFIEIGTGSGCIAISLTKRVLYSKIIAIELKEEALRVAVRNGERHGVSSKICWICGDVVSPLRREFQADAILSNPPYIPSEEMTQLPTEVLREPWVAFDGGEEGLHVYRRIVKEASPFLKKGGFLFLEIGDQQEKAVKEIFSKDPFLLLEVRKDISGTPRVLIFQKVP